ncbi:DUF192 domain-containing protein [Coraliomargarita parva]|uniref:DUF192 domain-containing protein n=1 Tax=Coraliomargarita parva TaxID=3014050 RepID=UPI0022B4E151|nr:DUF192 domain-containing protein [Coraliomargarita parva]
MRLNNFLLLPLACCALLLGACKPDTPVSAAPKSSDHYFEIQLGEHPIQLQLATNDPERTKGLMYRDELKPDHGMLFIFKDASQRAFWMRNTRIPLDIGYFDTEGRLMEIHALYPYDETSVPSRSHSIQLVLEMNRGWFKAHEVHPGDRFDMADVRAALSGRGLTPEKYNLPE